LVKSVHLEQNVLARNKTFLPGTKYSCLQHTTCPSPLAISLSPRDFCLLFFWSNSQPTFSYAGPFVYSVNPALSNDNSKLSEKKKNMKGVRQILHHLLQTLWNSLIMTNYTRLVRLWSLNYRKSPGLWILHYINVPNCLYCSTVKHI
jgi:hypothetical protein